MEIIFWQNPWAWIKDKYYAGSRNFGMFVAAFIPTVFVVIGLIADMVTLKRDIDVSNTLMFGLIMYGLINLLILINVQRSQFRVNKERGTYRLIHKELIERIRDYQAIKSTNQLKLDDIRRIVKEIIHNFNEQYMNKFHRKNVLITVKYLIDDSLIPIRDGDEIGIRDEEPQALEDAHVYQYLSQPGKKKQVLYIKNVNRMNKSELRIFGQNEEYIRDRAKKNNYKTFIALPIRTGNETPGKVSMKKDIGIIGFDLNEAYGFGSLREHEINILGCLSDLLSEPLSDIIRLTKKQSAA